MVSCSIRSTWYGILLVVHSLLFVRQVSYVFSRLDWLMTKSKMRVGGCAKHVEGKHLYWCVVSSIGKETV